jgi:hypothetical protein
MSSFNVFYQQAIMITVGQILTDGTAWVSGNMIFLLISSVPTVA